MQRSEALFQRRKFGPRARPATAHVLLHGLDGRLRFVERGLVECKAKTDLFNLLLQFAVQPGVFRIYSSTSFDFTDLTNLSETHSLVYLFSTSAYI
jgi:hypothetical protein